MIRNNNLSIKALLIFLLLHICFGFFGCGGCNDSSGGSNAEMIIVPNVVGMLQSDAETAISSSNLTIGSITDEESITVPEDHIISQNPQAGTSVEEGTSVNLVSSLGYKPPDPTDVAPSLDDNIATSLASSTEFIYSGENPIQVGVEPGIIKSTLVGVLRGKTLTKQGNPLPGVKITILNHPEYGYTYSREDGTFDMAANGGGLLTFTYEKEGYITAQRQINVPWQDYAKLPDVVLLPYDTNVKTIDFYDPIQVFCSSVVSDDRGERRAVLFFSQDTNTIMEMPDRSIYELDKINVRATEYTVGNYGPESMPAVLPPTSGYTYCVELSADEAVSGKAIDVRFDQPIYTYIEDTIGFPVGSAVPTGYYNREEGRWVASENGRVVEILSNTLGMADLDTDGDGFVDDPATLEDLGITDAEREELANIYPDPPQVLWRVPITHFTPWDCNWPYGPPEGAESPNQPDPETSDPECDPCEGAGSIIEYQNQVLGERIPIAGTPFSLNYRSSRVKGNKASYNLNVSLSGGAPHSVQPESVFLDINVGGQHQHEEITYDTILANIEAYAGRKYPWDGNDAFGRKMQGAQPVSVNIGFVYEAQYYSVANDFEQSFASARGGAERIDSDNNPMIALTQKWKGIIGTWDMQAQKIGGWSLDIHHFYSPTAKVLYLGNGQRRTNTRIPAIIKTIAGNGSSLGDGGPAIDAELGSPFDIAMAPDGSYYIADQGDHRIRYVNPDGVIITVAGNGTEGFSGDGGPAVNAQLNGPMGVSIAPDGRLYIADSFNNRIRCIDTNGIITTIAGDGIMGSGGDGGPATEAQLFLPFDVSVAPDGSVYIVDTSNSLIRRVGTDGIITTVAGGGSDPGDGGPAIDAQLALPWGVTAASDGNLYIAEYDSGRIRCVSIDGIITTVAGGGSDDPGDGGLATDALLTTPTDVVVAPDGGIYIAHLLSSGGGGFGCIRHVGTDGIITTIAGGVTIEDVIAGKASVDDLTPATQAVIMPTSIAVIPDGTLYITSGNIVHITQPLSGYSAEDIFIPSEDGSELYHFDPDGRHLKTLNTMTGSTIYEFTYNDDGLLISLEDVNGNTTTIERDGSGNATAIIGPYGQSTTLSYDSNDYLSNITNPAAESHLFEYTDDGLLTKHTDPRSNEFKYEYDDMGLLTNIKQPNSTDDYKTLKRDKLDDGYEVNLTTAEGRTASYLVEELSSGEKRILNSSGCCGNEVIMSSDGTQTITYADGTVITQQDGPDPRWGIQAPVTKNFSIELPSNLLYETFITHEVDLADPFDLFSINSMTTIMRINFDQYNPLGPYEEYTSYYNAATQTLTSTTREGRSTVIILDGDGRIIQAQYGDLYPFNFSYDSNGRVQTITQGSGVDERVISITHNTEGYQGSITNPIGQSTGLLYDWAGRVTSASLPGGRTLGITYDANGNPTSITPPGRPSHSFAYNTVNLMSEYDPPYAYSGEDGTLYDYDLDHQLITITRPDGKSLDVIYDGNTGRIEELAVSRGSVDYTYNGSTGQLSSITSPDDVTNTFAYDGFLLTDEAWSGEINGSVSSTYNKGLRVDSTAVIPEIGSPSAIIFGEDYDGRVTSAGSLSISRETSTGFVSETALGLVTTVYTYNGFGEIESYTVNDGASDVFSQIFERDKLGRIIRKTESVQGSADVTYDYTYDDAGRLINVSVYEGASNFDYTYDDNGNRMSYDAPSTENDVTCISDDYDNQDRLIDYGDNHYEYTNNGDLSSKTVLSTDTTTYEYDVLGNLISVTLPDTTVITYIIDGKNRRVGKKRNGTLEQVFLYKDNLIVAELDGGGNLISRFVYASKLNIPDYMIKGGITYRIISDLQGSPRLIVNIADGTIVQRIDYDEFGNIINDTNPGFQPFGFAGGLYDIDTKLVRFGARDYDPETGRWTTKDPIRFMGGDTNLYGYVMNDPINFIDPSGLCSATITMLKGDVQVEPGAPCEGEGNMNDIIGPIEEGFNLKEGDTVKTGPKSRVEIKLGDNAVIRLGSNSKVTISDSLCNASKTPLKTRPGARLEAWLRRAIGVESNFEVKTGTAVAGVRG